MGSLLFLVLIFSSCLITACGGGYEGLSDYVSNESKDTEEPKDPNKDNKKEDEDKDNNKETDPFKPQIAKACYYSEASSSEVCLDVTPPTTKDLQGDYAYSDPFSDSSFPSSFNRKQYIAPKNLISLENQNETLQLTPHFKLNELMQKRKGSLAIFSTTVLNYIENMRTESQEPIWVHSAYRSPGYNSGIRGSAKWSRHMYGDAIDFHIEGRDIDSLKDLCLKHGASFFQIYRTHIHCDWRNTPLDKAFYGEKITPSGFVNITALAHSHSKIQVKDLEKHWELSVHTDFIEDTSGDIAIEWQIKRGKKIKTYKTKKVLVKKKGKKPYHVKVNLGGSINLETQIQ